MLTCSMRLHMCGARVCVIVFVWRIRIYSNETRLNHMASTETERIVGLRVVSLWSPHEFEIVCLCAAARVTDLKKGNNNNSKENP